MMYLTDVISPTDWPYEEEESEIISRLIGSGHGGRKRPVHSSSSPKHLLQNVISGIFSSSIHSVYRLEVANFLRTFSHVGIFDPAL